MLRLDLAGLLLVASLAGCADTVTRVTTVAPRGAADYEPRGRVIALNGAPVNYGIVSREGRAYVLQTANRRGVLRDTDRVTVELVYGDGDEVPGEGVLHVRNTPGLIVGGSFVLAAGAADFAAAGALWNEPLIGRGSGTIFLASGAIVAAGGLAMIAIGLVPRGRIFRSEASLSPRDIPLAIPF